MPPEQPVPFKQVFQDECADIHDRREFYGLPDTAKEGIPANLKGLALSGGGIRSATFCLGLLQRLNAAGALKHFDYLSTVSGGGFIGGWWSAWLARKQQSQIFPPAERLESQRGSWPIGTASSTSAPTDRPEGSESASIDPVHHLRLFANYLTPRKGALSGDTWRAITVVSRNLFLTVLMLVPLLGAAILASQFYFTADHELVAPYVCNAVPTLESKIPAGSTSAVAMCANVIPADSVQHREALIKRAVYLGRPLLVLTGALLLSLVIWMFFSIGGRIMALIATTGVVAIGIGINQSMDWGDPSTLWQDAPNYHPLRLMLVGAIPIALMALYVMRPRKIAQGVGANGVKQSPASELLTNRMTRSQTVILVLFTAIALTLTFGGFAHELIKYVLLASQEDGAIGARVAKAGGWFAVLWAAAGAIYTGVRAAPTGGGDSRPPAPGLISRVVFIVTPPVVLLVLMMGIAYFTHNLLSHLLIHAPGTFQPLIFGFFVAIAICGVFGTYEFWTDAGVIEARTWAATGAAIGLGVAAALVAQFVVQPLNYDRSFTAAFIGIMIGIVAMPWVLRALLALRFRPSQSEDERAPVRRRFTLWLLIVLPLVGALSGWVLGMTDVDSRVREIQGSPLVVSIALGGIVFAVTFVLIASVGAIRMNHRTLSLQSVMVALLGPMVMQQFLNPTLIVVAVPMDVIALVGIVIGTIVGLGWMLDPNYLSLHTFYRARLVRAYMGATNAIRLGSGAAISDSVDGDDVPLAKLATGKQGAPCHLINTTLNLVGGRDLATAQRSAAEFVLSRQYCGSLRTGFRPTDKYMEGGLSLGTAVAVSGAAASPNMGSKTPSAALAMLLALLNVRLGFWAPTPNQPRWKSPRPRLWPFYLLREFLSQTNDLSLYCYLTDGGHFDNTALYSLVQRGCRQMIVVDCGADPEPCFSDMGDAIRRCRIDFGTDIHLEVGNFRRDETPTSKAAHYVIGQVTYSAQHARDLGWQDGESLKGTIVWIKPALLPNDPAEVRQYALENKIFPQQSTADQWFDEAQFESYRRLGEFCGDRLIADGVVAQTFFQ